jgi:hypothetical protein
MSEPKLIDGVLVCMSKSAGLSGSKVDKEMTKEIEDDKEAGDGAGTWSNKLFPPKACGRKNSFIALRTHLSQMYRWHMENTYTFEDEVWRILPTKRVEAYRQVVETSGHERAKELLEEFLADYPNLKDLARRPKPEGRGDLFKDSDYPDEATIRAKFVYSVSYRPLPTSGGLNPNLFADAIEKLNELHAQRLAEANTTLVTRFLEPFKLLSEQLKDPAKRKMAPVLDSIREFSQIVPSLDLSGNTELVELAQQISVTFQDITPEIIKKDEEMQRFVGQTAESVVTALSRFGGLGQRKFAA